MEEGIRAGRDWSCSISALLPEQYLRHSVVGLLPAGSLSQPLIGALQPEDQAAPGSGLCLDLPGHISFSPLSPAGPLGVRNSSAFGVSCHSSPICPPLQQELRTPFQSSVPLSHSHWVSSHLPCFAVRTRLISPWLSFGGLPCTSTPAGVKSTLELIFPLPRTSPPCGVLPSRWRHLTHMDNSASNPGVGLLPPLFSSHL